MIPDEALLASLAGRPPSTDQEREALAAALDELVRRGRTVLDEVPASMAAEFDVGHRTYLARRAADGGVLILLGGQFVAASREGAAA